MKTNIAILFSALVLSLGLSSCSSSAGAKPYPKDTCIVSDNKLGSMGKPVSKVYQGQEVKFCCQPCVEEFDAAPAKFMAKLK